MSIFKSSVLVLLAFSIPVIANQWTIPDQDAQSIFFQGMMESQRQCAKYCGPKGMRATTGETVMCADANDLIHNPYIGKELDEIMLKNSGARAWYSPLRVVDYLQESMFTRKLKEYNMQILGTTIGMPTVLAHAVDVFRLNFGQEGDIDEHAQKVALCDGEYPQGTKILWGVSRGAAVAFNAHAQHKYENVKMLVLEGCFDTIENTISGRAPAWMKRWKLHTFFNYFLAMATKYKIDGASPIKSVDNFPEEVPVVFITSHADKNVPKECTDHVVEALRKRGKNPIHYLALKNATHNVYSLGDGEDQKKYRAFLHGLYKKYNLPYVADYLENKKS